MTTTQSSTAELRRKIVARLLAAFVLLGAVFFLTAGTLLYWQAWGFLAVTLVPASLYSMHLLGNNPALLERRLKTREKEPQQKRIVALSMLAMLGTFVLPGLDKRLGWSCVPIWLVLAADLVILLGYASFVLTLRENEYAARTIEVEPGQRVISSGPYSLVRHPMYLGASLIYLAAPLALGSYWALIPAALFPALLVARILNEEQVLLRDLAGYADYCETVRHRLIPGIW
jgi:protein-S-isoprenylcysteine O-methyltransferase Ste14